MGEILVHEFTTLDGIVDAPTWTFDFGFDPKMGEAIRRPHRAAASAILLGRTTYEMFEPAWSSRTAEDDPGAPFFNDTHEVRRLLDADRRDLAELDRSSGRTTRRRSAQLKADVDGDIYVSGSGTLVRAMLADGLVDELHLFVFPLTRGTGPRLFTEGAAPLTLSLGACEAYDERRHPPWVCALPPNGVKPG